MLVPAGGSPLRQVLRAILAEVHFLGFPSG